MKKDKKRVDTKEPERQDLFAIANAGRSHPSNTNHSDLSKKKPGTKKSSTSKKKKRYSP